MELWARSLRFLFIWELPLLATLTVQNSSFCLPSLGNEGQCCCPLALCPVLVTGRHREGTVRFFSVGSWVSLCLQIAGVVGFFFPFLVCFVFYLTFIVISMGIWSDIAIPS